MKWNGREKAIEYLKSFDSILWDVDGTIVPFSDGGIEPWDLRFEEWTPEQVVRYNFTDLYAETEAIEDTVEVIRSVTDKEQYILSTVCTPNEVNMKRDFINRVFGEKIFPENHLIFVHSTSEKIGLVKVLMEVGIEGKKLKNPVVVDDDLRVIKSGQEEGIKVIHPSVLLRRV